MSLLASSRVHCYGRRLAAYRGIGRISNKLVGVLLSFAFVLMSLAQSGCAGVTKGDFTPTNSSKNPTSVSLPPSIAVQPASQATTVGQTATFSVVATGTAPLSYQWLSNGTPIMGASSPNYTMPVVTASESGTLLTVVVSNDIGTATSTPATLTVSAPVVAVIVSPTSATLNASTAQQMEANVSGTSNTAVLWTVSGTGCSGAACGVVSSNGLYTSPVSVPSPPTVTVTATSVADSSKSASASLTIVAVASVLLTLSPLNANVPTSGTQLFTASVTGTSNTAVSWSLHGAGCSGAACGTLATSLLSAVYAGPAVAPSPAAVSVVATSAADPTKSASAGVTIVPTIVVGIAPASASVVAGATQQFAALVTGTSNTAVSWSVSGAGCNGAACGTIRSGGLYAAPAVVPSPATVIVTATSAVDGTKSASADVTTTVSAPTVTRDWRHWPFSQSSPWNQPIGDNALYTIVPGLSALSAGLNYNDAWTSSIVIASAADPSAQIVFNPATGPASNRTFLSSGGKPCKNTPSQDSQLMATASSPLPFAANYYSTLSTPDTNLWVLPTTYLPASLNYESSARLPAGACPSPDNDAGMAVFQPDGLVLDTYNTIVTGSGAIVTSMASFVDGKGDGTGAANGRRASMVPSFAGLIRDGEISGGHIPHALAAIAPQSILQTSAVWPAAAFDRSSNYAGTLPMGSLLAIPASVDVTTLGLSPQGLVIAHAAQDYGVYVVDSGGGGFTFLAELGDPEIRWAATATTPPWWQDVQIILNNLRRVANNTASSPGGGGTPRGPLAPPFSN